VVRAPFILSNLFVNVVSSDRQSLTTIPSLFLNKTKSTKDDDASIKPKLAYYKKDEKGNYQRLPIFDSFESGDFNESGQSYKFRNTSHRDFIQAGEYRVEISVLHAVPNLAQLTDKKTWDFTVQRM